MVSISNTDRDRIVEFLTEYAHHKRTQGNELRHAPYLNQARMASAIAKKLARKQATTSSKTSDAK